MTWKKQVQSQSAKAKQIFGYVKRTTNSIKSIATERTIYLTIVRAHLAYTSPVWAPQTVDNIRTLIEYNDARQNTYLDYHIAAVSPTKNDFYKQI
jgi:regulator of sigma D